MKEEEKKGRNRQHNHNNWSNKGKEKSNHFPDCKYYQKTSYLEAWFWLKSTRCRNCKQCGHNQKLLQTLDIQEEHLFMVSVQQVSNTTKVNNSSWLIDSGCTNHMSIDVRLFKELERSYESKVRIANGKYMKVEGKWEIEVETMTGT